MNRLISVLMVSCASVVMAEPTPPGENIPDEKETLVTCAWKESSLTLAGITPRPGEYTYKLWLPKGYNADQKRKWPCMFIASPGGKAGMANMAQHLKRNGYVVVMLQESSNANTYGGSDGNFLAAHDDVVERCRIIDGLKFHTGMSGGARQATFNVQWRPGFAGVFLQAAGFCYTENNKVFTPGTGGHFVDKLPRNSLAIACALGYDDMNFIEMAKVSLIARKYEGPTLFLPISFPGGHGWSPADVCEKAFSWLECKTMMNGVPTTDTKAVARLWLRNLLDWIPTIKSRMDRLGAMQNVSAACWKQALDSDPLLASDIVKLRQDITAFTANPDHSREIQANSEFWKQFDFDMKALLERRKLPKDDPKRKLITDDIAEQWKKFADRFPDTEASSSAKLRAAAFEKIK